MATIKIKFRPSTVPNNEGSLYFQIIHNRVVKLVTTQYKLYETEWNAATERIVFNNDDPSRKAYLSSIDEQLSWDILRLKKVTRHMYLERPRYTADDIVEAYMRQTENCSFIKFMENRIAQLRQMNYLRTSETYAATLRSFMTYRQQKDIAIDAFNSDLMMGYESFLKAKGVCLNTISFYMRIMRAVYNRAVEMGITEQRKPFRHVYTSKERTVKRAVPIQTIKAIINLDLTGNPRMQFARDLFMFSFYTRGMSFVDIAHLQKKNLQNGYLTYRRRKTNQRLTIKWEKCMEEIVKRYPSPTDRYLLPIITDPQKARQQYIYQMQSVNHNLKKISTLLGLPRPLTMYVARHSWASAAKSKNVPISVISEGMGHESEKTTQIYLASLETEVVDKVNRMILKLLQ